MAEIAIILGVQAVVIGAVAGLNYNNTSEGFGSWRLTALQRRTEEAAEQGTQAVSKSEFESHQIQSKQAAHMNPAGAVAPVTLQTASGSRLASADFHGWDGEDMEMVYE